MAHGVDIVMFIIINNRQWNGYYTYSHIVYVCYTMSVLQSLTSRQYTVQ